MSRLENALTQIEELLRSLVEDGTARLLGQSINSEKWLNSSDYDLATSLLQALRDHAEMDDDGEALAPNLYVLRLPSSTAQTLHHDLERVDDLAAYVYQSGSQAGFNFMCYPIIEIHSEPTLMQDEKEVEAHISPRRKGNTTAVLVLDQVHKSKSGNAFLIVNGNWTYSIEKSVINIGRREDNDLVLNDARVSRSHAQLRQTRGRHTIFDLGSKGGTFVNGLPVVTSTSLLPGDVISLAGVTLIFGCDDPPSLEETVELDP